MVDVIGTLRLDRLEANGRVERLPSGAGAPVPVSPGGHDFQWSNTFWICKYCMVKTKNPRSLLGGRRHCRNLPFVSLLEDSRGHALFHASLRDGGVFVFCKKCFYYACPHPRKLLEPCKPRPKDELEGSSNRFYIRKGLHPVSKEPLLRPSRLHGL